MGCAASSDEAARHSRPEGKRAKASKKKVRFQAPPSRTDGDATDEPPAGTPMGNGGPEADDGTTNVLAGVSVATRAQPAPGPAADSVDAVQGDLPPSLPSSRPQTPAADALGASMDCNCGSSPVGSASSLADTLSSPDSRSPSIVSVAPAPRAESPRRHSPRECREPL